jgi:DNA-binding transcriptional ArsR family regulator
LSKSHHPQPMVARDVPGPIDYDGLGEILSALGYGTRLELLDHLRVPHTAPEIQLKPRRHRGAEPPAKTAARQTVQFHLEKLVEAGLVREELVEQAGRPVRRYAVNPQKLYGLVEELRRLSVLRAVRDAAAEGTGTVGPGVAPPALAGPRLVLVHGVYEGKSFPLSAATARAGRWGIGRKRDLAVCLDYDPFVSVENAHLTFAQGQHRLTDDPRSKNGTWLNWQLLDRGASVDLTAGDIVGVGRSLLCFRPG